MRFFCCLKSVINVFQRSMTKTSHFRIVFLMINVVMSFFQGFDCFQQSASMLMNVNLGMVVQVFSIIN